MNRVPRFARVGPLGTSVALCSAALFLTHCDEPPFPLLCPSAASDAGGAGCPPPDASRDRAMAEEDPAALDGPPEADGDAGAPGDASDASLGASLPAWMDLDGRSVDVATDASLAPSPDATAIPTTASGGSAPDAAGDHATPPAACDAAADPKDAPCAVDETYGVFVASSGSDDGSGSKAQPLRTIAQGIALAARSGRSRVFVCQGRYGESISLGGAAGDISLYGGLDCIQGWIWNGGPVQVTAQGRLSALRIDATLAPVTIEDVSFTAPDAVGQDGSGAGLSSIAAWLSDATVTLRRVALIAGRGADGATGADGSSTPDYPVDQPTAPPGLPYVYAPPALGAGATNTCLLMPASSSQGGAGGSPGDGVMMAGYPGSPGSAVPEALLAGASSLFDGAGGLASSSLGCGLGDPGANGSAGPAGEMAASFGVLTRDGWSPSPGALGGFGQPGQGGGGGAGELYFTMGATFGGGGGGAGGCGGAGGGGGRGGGASFALVSLGSAVSLIDANLLTSDGGQGGRGGAGQPGQAGGLGAPGACGGGAGGSGAGGSGGGGGSGGISVAIAYQGVVPVYDTQTRLAVGAPGTEGPSGSPGPHATTARQLGLDGNPGSYGRGGLATRVLSF